MTRIVAEYLSNRLSEDVQSVRQWRRQAIQGSAELPRQLAQQFEALLTQQLLRSMRETVDENPWTDGASTPLFEEMQDGLLAQSVSRAGGFGLADALLQQITAAVQRSPEKERAVTDEKAIHPLRTDQALTPVPPAAFLNLAETAAVSNTTLTNIDAFMSALGPGLQTAAATLGVAPRAIAAHAALESGWGRRQLARPDGSPSYNVFGVKAGKAWKGQTLDAFTTEYRGNGAEKSRERFRAYPSYEAAFADYVKLLSTNKRYHSALNQHGDIAAFAQALQAGGYATDPDYAEKLVHVASSATVGQKVFPTPLLPWQT